MQDLHGWRSVGDATHIRLAAGEQATALADPQPLLREAVLSCVLPDVKAAGACGAFDILIAAADAGIGGSLHNPTGPVATAASLLVTAAVPNFHRLELGYGEVPWRGELLAPEETVDAGGLAVLRAPASAWRCPTAPG
jgi:galactonate dehydratase